MQSGPLMERKFSSVIEINSSKLLIVFVCRRICGARVRVEMSSGKSRERGPRGGPFRGGPRGGGDYRGRDRYKCNPNYPVLILHFIKEKLNLDKLI